MRPLDRRTWLLHIGTALAAAGGALPARAQSSPNIELVQLQAQKSDDGLVLSYQVRFDLPKEVEDALMKGLAVVFVARAEIFTERWYWSDKSRAIIERRWRLAYQPLSRHWRVSFDGLSQSYESLTQALAIIQRNGRWRLADNPSDDESSYLAFSFELDRNELPRPLQIGLSDQHEWHLQTLRRIPLPR
jgi:hypothetical protein